MLEQIGAFISNPAVSFTVGILTGGASGVIVGATGKYLADIWTDKRKAREAKTTRLVLFRQCEFDCKMESLFSTMRFRLVAFPLRRDFQVRTQNKQYSDDVRQDCFCFETEEHPDVHDKLMILVRHGFVNDKTPASTSRHPAIPTFSMTEEFVERLKATTSPEDTRAAKEKFKVLEAAHEKKEKEAADNAAREAYMNEKLARAEEKRQKQDDPFNL